MEMNKADERAALDEHAARMTQIWEDQRALLEILPSPADASLRDERDPRRIAYEQILRLWSAPMSSGEKTELESVMRDYLDPLFTDSQIERNEREVTWACLIKDSVERILSQRFRHTSKSWPENTLEGRKN